MMSALRFWNNFEFENKNYDTGQRQIKKFKKFLFLDFTKILVIFVIILHMKTIDFVFPFYRA